jgi:RimJ/RimL family protein N-acetyltransferase
MIEMGARPEFDLQPFLESDIDTLVGWIHNEELLVQWAGPRFSWPLTAEQLRQHLAAAIGSDSIRRSFKATSAAKSMLGYIELRLTRLGYSNRSAGLSRILVGPSELRGCGLGKEMIRRVLRIGFEDHGLHRIELAVYSQNEAAIRCYEHVGFKKEGFLRDVTRVGSDYWSEYRMRMLDSEWLALQRPVT